MSIVIASVLEPDAARTAAALRHAPAGAAFVEIRGDHLSADELAGLVRQAGRPVVATVRRPEDAGDFTGSEAERRAALLAALEAGARFIDVEWNGPLRDLATGPHAPRVILSHHGVECTTQGLARQLGEMAATAAARLKIVPEARAPRELRAVRGLLAGAADRDRRVTCFAMGRAGAASRILAPAWGSWSTYGAIEADRPTAPGQFTARDLLDVYRVLEIGADTRRFALLGRNVFGSPSPAMHRAGYSELGIDACYLPIEADDWADLRSEVGPDGPLGLSGLAVTMPFKERAAAESEAGDDVARASGAVNTVRFERMRWHGFNTDGPAGVEQIRRHLEPRGRRAVVVGAGGTARALAAALRVAGAAVTLVNRDPDRGRFAASSLGVAVEPLARLAKLDWDILVQATPLGLAGETVLPAAGLRGAVVLDAVYGVETPLVRDARARGLAVIDGLELLVAQARLQLECLTAGGRPAADTLDRAARRWLAERST